MCTSSVSKDTEARMEGVASRVLWITVLNNVSGWTFMVNYSGSCGIYGERG